MTEIPEPHDAWIDAVEVWRGQRVESIHRACLCIIDHHGGVVHGEGGIDQEIYPRSSLKPLQALPLVETGAADRFGLTQSHLALGCASHNGEPGHVAAVQAWLSDIGLDADHLACGAHPPLNRAAANAMVASGEQPNRLHNNCSGKHAAMLTICRHQGFDVAGYEQADHPLQKMIADLICHYADRTSLGEPAIDGCSLPNWPMRLRELALIMARLSAQLAEDPGGRILRAMQTDPFAVAGTGRLCTDLMRAAPGIVAKTGAEGVFIACRPGQGQAMALKVQDGATRASEVALMAALVRQGWIDPNLLPNRQRPELRNAAGLLVGHIQAHERWAA